MPLRILATTALIASLLLLCPAAGAQPQPAAVQTEEVRPEAAEAERILEDIERLRSGYRALEEEERKLEGEKRFIAALQMGQQVFELTRQVEKLVTIVVRQRGRVSSDLPA